MRVHALFSVLAVLLAMARPGLVEAQCLQEMVIAAGTAPSDELGYAVSISGGRILVGAPGHDTMGLAGSGAAYVFELGPGGWQQVAKLVDPTVQVHDQFGIAVSLSGNRALVGAYGANGSQGEAHVFDEGPPGTWTYSATLCASNGNPLDEFGMAVALDGDRALVGAYLHDLAGVPNTGAAYVFERQGGTWTETAVLTSTTAATKNFFGYSVALQGPRALVGAPRGVFQILQPSTGPGRVEVFDLIGSAWQQTDSLTACGGGTGDYFGYGLDLEGNRALVGAPGLSSMANEEGAAFVFERDPLSATWSSSGPLVAALPTAGDRLGWSACLDGSLLVGGAPQSGGAASQTGVAFLFDSSSPCSTAVTEKTVAIPSGGMGSDTFGFAVDAEAGTLVVGSRRDGTAGLGAGAFYVYSTTCLGTGMVSSYGSGVNPAGSLMVVSGDPVVGTMITFQISDPTGLVAMGPMAIAGSVLAVSPLPVPGYPPAGPLIPGAQMGSAIAPGELLVPLPPVSLPINGPLYAGPLTMASRVTLTIPPNCALCGVNVYLQGALVDVATGIGLTNGLELKFGC